MMDLAIIPPEGNIYTYYVRILHILYIYVFRIKPQFTNHSSRDFDSDGNETLAETETCACPTCTSRGTSFGKPRTAQRCLGREFTAAVITSCTRRWEIALQAAGGGFQGSVSWDFLDVLKPPEAGVFSSLLAGSLILITAKHVCFSRSCI